MLGVWLFIDSPLLHFVYTVFEFFVLFWLVRVMVQPSAGVKHGGSRLQCDELIGRFPIRQSGTWKRRCGSG